LFNQSASGFFTAFTTTTPILLEETERKLSSGIIYGGKSFIEHAQKINHFLFAIFLSKLDKERKVNVE